MFAGKKSAQIREILISESAWEEMTCLFAPSLSQVCEKYFGLKPSTAEKRAAMGDLPIPTFRVAESQKAPRMIHIQDLANHIDEQLQKGRDLLEQMKIANH